VPTSKDQCKDGGWQTFNPLDGPFKNQGQCVAYVNQHEHDDGGDGGND
jgi:hypothetical protein